jgi:probable H4MPT-linked C1 transfer pathway protein
MTNANRVQRQIVGADIGGANLKYCSTSGKSFATRFPMWEQSDLLAQTLKRDLGRFESIDALAVTMTGELADCFIDRADGVGRIIDQVMLAASDLGIDDIGFYGVDGCFHSERQAKADADNIAAANWHALSSFAADLFPKAKTLVDIGSTTTDIVPLSDGQVATVAQTDHGRLVEGSLVYVGCKRTSVCSLVNHLRFDGTDCPVMKEVFATIDDARLLIGSADEDETDCDTADHRPRTIQCAANRMARMIGLDRRSVSIEAAHGLADQVVAAAGARIQEGWRRIHRPGLVVIAGHGADLLNLDPSVCVEDLADHLGPAVSRCAPSFAVASLYAEYAKCAGGARVRCGA